MSATASARSGKLVVVRPAGAAMSAAATLLNVADEIATLSAEDARQASREREIAELWIIFETGQRATERRLHQLTQIEDCLVQLLDRRAELHGHIERCMLLEISTLQLLAQWKDGK